MKCSYCKKDSGEKRFCSKNCKSYFHLRNWRRRTKAKAVIFMGGKCKRCGYRRCQGAMIFHHKGKKSFGIGGASSWAKILIELKKCILICLNCHEEEHCKNPECVHV